MDTITHALTGALIGSAVREKAGRAGFACALAASVAPDLDMPLRFFGSAAFLEYHRVALNSLVVAPFLALGVALVTRRFGGCKRLLPLFAIAFVTILLHAFMDLTNSYGAKPLWPLVDKWYALDMVFILDPWITGTLVLGLAAMRRSGRRALVFAACAVIIVSYWGGRAYLHGRALDSFRLQYPEAYRVGAFPAPVDPFRWKMVAETKTAFWSGWYGLMDGGWDDLKMYPKTPEDKVTRLARKAPVARVFLEFARFPWISYAHDGDTWTVRMQDLRFSLSDEHAGFVTTVKVYPDGRVGPGEFSFR